MDSDFFCHSVHIGGKGILGERSAKSRTNTGLGILYTIFCLKKL